VFERFFNEALSMCGALVVVRNEDAAMIGSSCFYGFKPEPSEIAIGYTFLAVLVGVDDTILT